MVSAGAGGLGPAASITWRCLCSRGKQVDSLLWTLGPALVFCVGMGKIWSGEESPTGKVQALRAPSHGERKEFGKSVASGDSCIEITLLGRQEPITRRLCTSERSLGGCVPTSFQDRPELSDF